MIKFFCLEHFIGVGMSSINQNFYSSLGGLWNIPGPDDGTGTPEEQILTIGTPTSTEASFGFVVEGRQLAFTVKGNFQYPSASKPQNLAEALVMVQVGDVTEQLLSLNGVIIQKELFTPAVSLNDFNLCETDKAAAARVYSGDDTFIGATDTAADDENSDTIDGFAGNDVFFGNGAGKYPDNFYGGDGIDTSVLRGKLSNYDIAPGTNLWNSYTNKSELKGSM